MFLTLSNWSNSTGACTSCIREAIKTYKKMKKPLVLIYLFIYLFIICVNCFELGVILHHCCFLLGESFPHNSESDIVPLTFPAALFFFLDSCSVITSRFHVLTVRRFLIITYSMHLTHTRRLDSNDRCTNLGCWGLWFLFDLISAPLPCFACTSCMSRIFKLYTCIV